MKRILISLVLILMGLYTMTQVTKLLDSFATLHQLVILTVFIIIFSYLSVEVIVLMMRTTNMLKKEETILQTWHGHFSNLLGGFVLAYSYTFSQLGLLIVGVVIIWLAMLLMTRVDRQKTQSTLVPGDLELPGALEDIPNAKKRDPNTKVAARAIDPTDARAKQASAFSVKNTDNH